MRSAGDIQLATLNRTFVGDAAAIYPQAVSLGISRTFDWPVFVVAVQLSTSLVVYPMANSLLGGIFLTFDQNQATKVAISDELQSVIGHLTSPNSIPGVTPLAQPSSKVSNIPFGGCGYYLKAKSPITLWGVGETTAAGQIIWGMASIQYRKISG